MTEETRPVPEAVAALAAALGERFGTVAAGHDGDVPALVWTDGPAVDELAEAARALAPETAGGLAFRRGLSERWIALGAIRLAPGPLSCGLPVPLSPAAVEAHWWRTRLPVPVTPREERLVYGLLYEVHDDHRRDEVTAQEICTGLNRRGLAALLLRSGAELTPAELLTARYAASHGHLAWRHALRTMPVPVLLRAVRDDPQAPPDCLAAARALESAPDGAS
ncbi:hypothetical protein ACI2LJ_31690 [Streptomyces sp. NPDC088090]|uniref:hypothetical protein n=1 Tax=Streptomyces sp. NPDC088090 TaxID=3365822 RepID=UPI00384E73A7